ncbi:MAG TPA: hypothetical protein PLC54_07605, partial [Spirochaetales bacterium]|nr:hypothetical protein [Spirochaetales bacterium]
STGSGGTHSIFDSDSGLEEGVAYEYKIVAYTDATHSITSAIATSTVMKPFKAELSSPANRAVIDISGGVSYQFTISETSLWDAAVSDYFYFQPMALEKTGNPVFIGRFRYNFVTSTFQVLFNGAYQDIHTQVNSLYGKAFVQDNFITYDSGTITVKALVGFVPALNAWSGAAAEYKDGQSYEWDVNGTIGSNPYTTSDDEPTWFEKAYTNGIAKTYADGYNDGASTANGRFEFVAVLPTP